MSQPSDDITGPIYSGTMSLSLKENYCCTLASERWDVKTKIFGRLKVAHFLKIIFLHVKKSWPLYLYGPEVWLFPLGIAWLLEMG